MVKAMRLATAATLAAATLPGLSDTGHATARGADPRLQPLASQSASTGTTINYQPTIHLSGDATKAKDDFKAMLETHKRDIKRMMDEEIRREARRKH